jgi:adenosylhomocysteine nucleosidase
VTGRGPGATGSGPAAPTGLIGAMPEELEQLLSVADGVRSERLGPFELVYGSLAAAPVVMATCGVGKVNAAALTQALATAGAARMIVTGVAGGIDASLAIGDLVVSEDAVQHDVDATGLGYALGEVPGEPRVWLADAALRDAALAAAADVARRVGVRAVLGRVASGDVFVSDPRRTRLLRERFEATCAEMEGAAVAQVCSRWGIPWVVVRSVSDTADHVAEVDFRAFTRVAAERAVAVVVAMLQALA